MAEDMTFSGPLFDGRAEVALRAGVQAVRHKLADEAQKLTVATLASSIQHEGTGKALRAVTQTDVSRTYVTTGGSKSYSLPVVVGDIATDTVVTTDLATYGPWLEGTGSRNDTTRFKGYHAFRQAAQQLDASAEVIADLALMPYVEAMNA
jgi:hypothetical protein